MCQFPTIIRDLLQDKKLDVKDVQEIRLRLGLPVIVYIDGKELLFSDIKPNRDDFNEMLELATNHSLYAYESEIGNGFITISGGHRIGLCGKYTIKDNGLGAFQNIAYANFRIAHDIRGCSDKLFRELHCDDELYDTIIISPPGCGKTTMLRDLIRNISDGKDTFTGRSIGVCDERFELAAFFDGQPQNYLGLRSDIISGCDKENAIDMLIRTMSPRVIAIDELGVNEYDKIPKLKYSGCNIIATIHGSSISDVERKLDIHEFKRAVILSLRNGPGTVEGVIAL